MKPSLSKLVLNQRVGGPNVLLVSRSSNSKYQLIPSGDDQGIRGESHKSQVTRIKAKTKIGNELFIVVLDLF
jgi:hypothetical protein